MYAGESDADTIFRGARGGAHAVGHPPVGDPPEALSDVRSADARSAEIDRCAGVVRPFQVSLYSVEPLETVR